MHPKANTESAVPFAVRETIDGHHATPNPNLAADGFNIWWQKTAAQNVAMLAEASDLIRAHRQINSGRWPAAGQAH